MIIDPKDHLILAVAQDLPPVQATAFDFFQQDGTYKIIPLLPEPPYNPRQILGFAIARRDGRLFSARDVVGAMCNKLGVGSMRFCQNGDTHSIEALR